MLSLTKICILIAILLVAMEVRGANVKTPNEYQDIQMMEEEKEATGDSIDEMEENVEDEAEKENNLEDKAVNPEEESDNNLHDNDVEDEAGDEGKNCDCDDKVNKALVNSLATCSQTLSTIENCKVGKVSSIGTSDKHVVPCTCNKALTAHLVKSLKSCTQAVETLTKCKKGGESGGETVYNVNSCDELKKKHSTLKSGNYKLRIGGKDVPVYCHMGELCGITGGWTRLGHLKMSSDHKTCPNEQFSYINKGGLHLCRIKSDKAGCATTSYSSHGIKYSTICGYAKGYQKGAPVGFDTNTKALSLPYLDGVSFQRFDVSTTKREHVWSYACGLGDKAINKFVCPCNAKAPEDVKQPSFVGKNYYCESAIDEFSSYADFFPKDPLWDGKGFENFEGPCRKDMMPYFKRTYTSPITDVISVKLCRTELEKYRAVYLEGYGVFVK